MSIERLNWDSQFFGIEVGSTSREQLLTVPDAEVISMICYILRKRNL